MNNYPQLDLKQHYVAFLDVLGFSEMVEADTQGDKQEYLAKLFKCHQSAAVIFHDNINCSITQFSDSIVVAIPYDVDIFEWFILKLAEYQRLLLDEGLLCRGGIAVNKHFSNGSFTFSAGLIQAYRVESKSARYPRVVVSPDVLDLIFPNEKTLPSSLITEDDGLSFVDYIGVTQRKKPKLLKSSILSIVEKLVDNPSSSVREKGVWLAAYSDAILKTNFSRPKFKGKMVKN